jgi:gluconolactonase
MLTPNGIGLSPDERTVYVAETESARLWAFDLDEPGVARKQTLAPHGGRFICGPGGFQRFDSLAVDESGDICVATLVTGAVTVISPAGEVVKQVRFSDPHTTNICFGGVDRRTAYVTLSGVGQLVEIPWEGAAGLRLAYEI